MRKKQKPSLPRRVVNILSWIIAAMALAGIVGRLIHVYKHHF